MPCKQPRVNVQMKIEMIMEVTENSATRLLDKSQVGNMVLGNTFLNNPKTLLNVETQRLLSVDVSGYENYLSETECRFTKDEVLSHFKNEDRDEVEACLELYVVGNERVWEIQTMHQNVKHFTKNDVYRCMKVMEFGDGG